MYMPFFTHTPQGVTNGFPLKIEVIVKEEKEAEFHAGAYREACPCRWWWRACFIFVFLIPMA